MSSLRHAIAAVNDGPDIRVYTTGYDGNIYETKYEQGNGWIGDDLIATGKPQTPIAAVCNSVDSIRVFYLSPDNMLQEMCYEAQRGWYSGTLNNNNWVVAESSKIAACCYPRGISIFAQLTDGRIVMCAQITEGGSWGNGSWIMETIVIDHAKDLTGKDGTDLACTCLAPQRIKVYFTNTDDRVVEVVRDGGQSWHYDVILGPSTPPRAVISFEPDNRRLFYSAADTIIGETYFDGVAWNVADFSQVTTQNHNIAAISWGTGEEFNIRLYYSALGSNAFSELCYTGSSGVWTHGVSPVPLVKTK